VSARGARDAGAGGEGLECNDGLLTTTEKRQRYNLQTGLPIKLPEVLL
jgi:hypothetical protein